MGNQSRKNCNWPRRKRLRAVAVTKEVESKKIADQLEENKSAALKSLFGIAGKSKKNNKDIVRMSYIRCKDANVKMNPKDKMKVWKEYKEKPLNEEND